MALSTFSLLCNHQYHLSLQLFHFPKLKLYPLKLLSMHHSSQPLATTILFLFSINVTTLGSSCKWNYNICPFGSGLFHLPKWFQDSSISDHVPEFLTFLRVIILYSIYRLHFICFSLNVHLGCFQLLDFVSYTVKNMNIQTSESWLCWIIW